MAQNYNINCFQGNHIGDMDITNMENNFECLRSNFSGVSSPANTVGGNLWFDTGNKSLKMKNYPNDAWYALFLVDSTHKLYVYNNSAPDGWIIDSSISDVVLSMKYRGMELSTLPPYYNGGTTSGTWTIPTKSFDHNHQWYDYIVGDDKSWDSNGVTEHVIGSYNYTPDAWRVHSGTTDPSYPWCYYYKPNDSYTDNETININLGSSWRPYAAVGTLQYLNI